MLQSHNELLELQASGVIENSKPEHVNSSSIDITLGKIIHVEMPHPEAKSRIVWEVDPSASPDNPYCRVRTDRIEMDEKGYVMAPHEIILAQSVQVFNLPNHISAEYKLKSSMARNFLEHLTAGWCDAGWNGSVLTLELCNMSRFHNIRLRPGMKIGQMVFFRHTPVPDDASYAARGQYNKDTEATPAKVIK